MGEEESQWNDIRRNGGHLSPEKGQLRVQTRSRWRSWHGILNPLAPRMPGITTWIITRIWSRNKPCYCHLQIFDITPHTQHEQHKQLPKKNQLNPSIFCWVSSLCPLYGPTGSACDLAFLWQSTIVIFPSPWNFQDRVQGFDSTFPEASNCYEWSTYPNPPQGSRALPPPL